MRFLSRATVLMLAVGALLLVPVHPPQAQAHPLGNFTVNHYDAITLSPDRVEVLSVLDSAEIPTVQQRRATDTDGDGTISAAEGAAHADMTCAAMLPATSVAVDGVAVVLTVTSATAEYPIGEQGLPTTRVTCLLAAAADLDGRATVTFADTFAADRIGWREITATGDGLRIDASDVPAESISDELRAYPEDLLASPRDQRSAQITVVPGSGTAVEPLVALPVTGVGWFDSAAQAVERLLSGIAAGPQLSPVLATLAVVMSLVLGASHAALPGHGKTVMAAYLAGKQGTRRDALVVGATVTVTHTAGVLVFGVLLSLVATFSPVTALRWLGVVSGLLVAAVGVLLLRTAIVRRRELAALPAAERTGVLVGAAIGTGGVGHGHGHGVPGYGHGHGGHGVEPDRWSRTSLIGMGMAGGLVPSPTAVIVLLAAVRADRPWFGLVLVACYALGMAGTLTAAGLLLVSVRDRLVRMERTQAWRDRAGRLLAALPVATALLVLAVGVGLALRSLAGF
ncbi:High-affinity nickel-transporter [Pseudonocardia sp.]|uniref:nickel/cobalt transporter n=1 Tax=Pseudonocardia sp. TaxID=60912 RepID=UPI00260646B0|nr:High-affinity nickel-transporter [Pseudonocardia sp.]